MRVLDVYRLFKFQEDSYIRINDVINRHQIIESKIEDIADIAAYVSKYGNKEVIQLQVSDTDDYVLDIFTY